MLDRRKFAAPVFAQAAAFVVVLLIGGLAGSHPKPNPTPTPTPSLTPRASASATHGSTITTTPAALSKLTVEVTEEGAVPVTSIQMQLLQAGTHRFVLSGKLSPVGTDFQWAQNVPEGTYLVCVSPPSGTRFTGVSADVLPGWFCAAADAGPGSPAVTFSLVAKVSSQASA